MKSFKVLFIPFIFYLIYINYTAENIVYMDQMRLMGLVETFFEGDLHFSDLWVSYLGHRSLGYFLLLLINAKYFHLNTLLEVNASAMILFIISITIYRFINDNDTIDHEFKKSKFSYLFFLTIIITIFSINKWETALLGLGLNEYIPHLLFIIMTIQLNRLLITGSLNKKGLIVLFLTLNISVFFFSLAYLIPFFAAAFLITIFGFFLNKNNSRLYMRTIILYWLNVLIASLIYLKDINDNSSAVELNIMMVLLNNIPSAFKFYLLGLSGGVIGSETINRFFSINVAIVIGFVLFLVYGISMYLFFKKELYKKTYFPFMLILYSLVYMMLILIGRFSFSVTYGMQSRYALAMGYGVVGIVWILMLSYSYVMKNHLRFFMVLFLLITIVIMQTITIYDEIDKSVYRKASYLNMRETAYNKDIGNWKIFQSTEQDTIKAFEILEKYRLNVFYDYGKKELKNIGSNIKTAKFLKGYYKEGDKVWLSKEAEILIKSSNGSGVIKGYMPDSFKENSITIYSKGNQVLHKKIKPGDFEFTFNIEPNSVAQLRIEVEKSFVPAKLGINNDTRELGIIVSNLTVE